MNEQRNAAPPASFSNPLLERVRLPGETFTLPSGGLFYTNGELDDRVENGEVIINPMTAIDEVIIRTPDKLFSGEGINDVFGRCVPQVRKGTELLARDVDFILLCLRKITYGNEFELNFNHNCEGAKDHSYIVKLDLFFQSTKRIDPTTWERKYSVSLSNGQTVRARPIRFKDIITMMHLMQGDTASIKEIKQVAILSLMMIIEQVDDIRDRKMIEEWVKVIPAALNKELMEIVNVLQDWGPKFEFKTACKDCGEEVDVAAPLNPTDFFMR